jgi:hypothetical protein
MVYFTRISGQYSFNMVIALCLQPLQLLWFLVGNGSKHPAPHV